ncbi:hypothetical protein GCM10007937_43380 [Mesorhizobium albiziae]|nr:hypothetical protein GCM10007937_43380 [Mesorhizobium albiziae]
MAVDPVAADEPGEDGAVDAARRAQIDIFYACALAQRGEFEPRREPFGVALGGFAIDKKPDASPVMIESRKATSATVRAIGPKVSNGPAGSTMPSLE